MASGGTAACGHGVAVSDARARSWDLRSVCSCAEREPCSIERFGCGLKHGWDCQQALEGRLCTVHPQAFGRKTKTVWVTERDLKKIHTAGNFQVIY